MLILKGRSGKSFVMERLMTNSDSIGICYANEFPIYNNLFICKRDEVNAYDFAHDWLYPKMEEFAQSDRQFDFLIIYTDLEEKDPEFSSLINDTKGENFPCTEVILMCK